MHLLRRRSGEEADSGGEEGGGEEGAAHQGEAARREVVRLWEEWFKEQLTVCLVRQCLVFYPDSGDQMPWKSAHNIR